MDAKVSYNPFIFGFGSQSHRQIVAVTRSAKLALSLLLKPTTIPPELLSCCNGLVLGRECVLTSLVTASATTAYFARSR